MQLRAPKTPPEDTRRTRRRKVFLAGAIAASGSDGERSLCVVHDLSEAGAQLELAGTGRFAGFVQVFLPSLERAVPARVMWQDGQRLGIRFEQRLPAAPLRPPVKPG